MLKNNLKLSLIILSLLLVSTAYADQNNNFFQQRYRGWLWFEKPTVVNKKPSEDTIEAASNDITPDQAQSEVEKFAKELEQAKFMMLARPTIENVRNYREKEQLMWEQAEKLEENWQMANLLYPDQRDLINNPVNVHAVKLKRQMEKDKESLIIQELAKNFDLILFFNSSCQYCQLLAPVLKNFGEQYGFNIEAISADGSKHEYFKTASAPQLIEQLGINAFPTVIAVSHDSKTAFELIRGYVSLSEIEEYSVLASKYLQAQQAEKHVNYR